jgi:uncharacterized protein YaiE (UPF0345 family)
MANHNSYFEGKVQSIGFRYAGKDFTVGVIEPGNYEFDANRFELIRVILGSLTDERDAKIYKGIVSSLGLSSGLMPEFAPGEKVKLSCTETVVYLCEYSDESFPKKQTDSESDQKA